MIKLIIWDLDGILWSESLSENNSKGILNQQVIEFIKETERHGIVHSVCSKNNFEKAKSHLQQIGLWDLFVFPFIDFSPKGPAVKQIIDDCQLQAKHVLFVDDNIINLNEVKYFCPDIQTSNDTEFVKNFNIPIGKTRTAQYKILEKKALDKDNIDFLKDSDIQITIASKDGCIEYHDRIVELVNRSNVLNFTNSRFKIDYDDKNLTPYEYFNMPRNNYAVFAWDKYGYYGLIGYFSTWDHVNIEHFVFSCRVLNMNIENYCAQYIQQYLKFNQPYLGRLNINESYDYITYHPYKDVETFIRNKESLPIISEKPIANIVAGCLSCLFWGFSKHNYQISYNQEASIVNLDNVWRVNDDPKLIVYSVPLDLLEETIDKYSFTKVKDNINHLVEVIRTTKRKMLLILPYSLQGLCRKDILELYDCWCSLVDNQTVFAVYSPNTHNEYRHWNRKELLRLANEMDNWITIHKDDQ